MPTQAYTAVPYATLLVYSLECVFRWLGTYPNTSVIPTMDEVILTFSRPLDKKRLLNRLISKSLNFFLNKCYRPILLTKSVSLVTVNELDMTLDKSTE